MTIDDARRCTARATTTGERCRKAAILGGFVCYKHGGGAPQVRAAANKRLELARLEEAKAKALGSKSLGELIEAVRPGAAELDPHQGLLEVVATTWAMRRALELLVAGLFPGGGDAYSPDDAVEASGGGMLMRYVPSARAGVFGTDHKGDAKPHVLVGMLGEWSDRHAQACKLAIAAGIQARQIEIAEAQAETIASVLRAMAAGVLERLAAVGVDPGVVSGIERELPGLMRGALELARTSVIDVAEAS